MIRTRPIVSARADKQGSTRADKSRGRCRNIVAAAFFLLIAAPASAQVATDVTVSQKHYV